MILEQGMQSGDVGQVQRQLNAVLGCKLNGKGVFGPLTAKRVRQFQEANGLPVTGICDEATRGALTQAFVQVHGFEQRDWQRTVTPDPAPSTNLATAGAGDVDATRPPGAEPARLDWSTASSNVSSMPVAPRAATRVGFRATETMDFTRMPDEVRRASQGNDWVMAFVPQGRSENARGTGIAGTFYVANTRTGETHAYPAVTGGLSGNARDTARMGPIPGSQTDFWGERNDAVNAVYSNARFIKNYNSSLHVNYAAVIKIDDTIDNRGGFLIHKANGRGGTIGCIGLENDAAVFEVGALVQRYGIRNMVVLNSGYDFNRDRQTDPRLTYASASAGDNFSSNVSGARPGGPLVRS